MRVFVSGGTGFIGHHLVTKLLARGYEIHALVRDPKLTKDRTQPSLLYWKGDITDRESMRACMENCEAVFHLAGWYKLGSRSQNQAMPINVDGTRNVFELALELGIKRIIYTSSLGVFGNTHGQFVDENTPLHPEQHFLTEYDRTKWLANQLIAQPLIAKGAPITIILPGVVYGPGDHSLIAQLMSAFLKGWLFLFPGPETFLSFTHVEDAAEGHILAFEKGEAGESYILTGTALTLWQTVELWAALTMKSSPRVYVPADKIKTLNPLAQTLNKMVKLPELISMDGIAVLGASYIGLSGKAREKLGWKSRSIEVGFKETLDWFANHKNNL